MGNLFSIKYSNIDDYKTKKVIENICLKKNHLDDNVKKQIYDFLGTEYLDTAQNKIFKDVDGRIFYFN